MLRKDCDIQDTICYIQKQLEKVGIETFLCGKNSFRDLWYSVRVEINGINRIGSNGKGVSYDAAMASAYGEFMERLESGFMLERLFPMKSKYCYDARKSTFYNVFDNKIESLDSSYIDKVCGTNGLSAGNSFYECFLQGLCEVFERYILKKIYFDKKIFSQLNVIDELAYVDHECYKYLLIIKECGYKVSVIDCSLNGKFPVLGVLIEHEKLGKYSFALGSDFNFDICVERCVTEIFQGKNLDITFRKYMNSYFDVLDEKNINTEYIKSVTSNSGILPMELLNLNNKVQTPLYQFFKSEENNESLIRVALRMVKMMNIKLYVKDYSWLGFPCIRVYIPGMSDINWNGEEDVIANRTQLSKYVHKCLITQKRNYEEIHAAINNNWDYYCGISDILGLRFKVDFSESDVLCDINLFFSTIAYIVEDYTLAMRYYEQSENVNKYEMYALRILEVYGKGIVSQVKNSYLKNIFGVLEKRAMLVMNFECNDCSKCILSSNCSYLQWKEIMDECNFLKKNYIETYDWLGVLLL